MGHETFESMLNRLVKVRDSGAYRTDPEHQEARLASLESIVQAMLERLRDERAVTGLSF